MISLSLLFSILAYAGFCLVCIGVWIGLVAIPRIKQAAQDALRKIQPPAEIVYVPREVERPQLTWPEQQLELALKMAPVPEDVKEAWRRYVLENNELESEEVNEPDSYPDYRGNGHHKSGGLDSGAE